MERWTDDQIDRYVDRWGEDPTNHWLVDAADLEGGEAVLDVGCGSGAALRYAAGKGHSGPLVGVDPYPRMIEHAERLRGPAAITFITAAAEQLPFGDASFDAVLAINSVHHWQNIDAGLTEIFRVLRPGGWFTYGGETFSSGLLPAGQDYSADLKALGFAVEPPVTLQDGRAFAARARKVGDV